MTDSELFTYIKDKKDYNEAGLDFDWKVEVYDDLKEIAVYIKETDSKLDWKLNFDFIPFLFDVHKLKVLVHRGYALSYLSARTEILGDLILTKGLYPTYDLCIYAWSKGSGEATILLLELIKNFDFEIKKFITFGSVKSVYFPFSFKDIKKAVGTIKEYVTPNDFVTWQIPFCRRIKKISVGDKFSLFKIFKTEYYHTNYDKFIKE